MLGLKLRLPNYWSGSVSLLACVAYLIYCLLHNEVPIDEGDGLQHFAISQQAWNEPILFLDHWNKPLYTLFSSLFAQNGQRYFPIFTLLCFVGTIAFIFRIFKLLGVNVIYAVIAPLLLLTVPDYTYGVLGGMTEPFFGLLTVVMLWALVAKKWLVFSLVASFTPFARSEGMLVVVIAVIVLLINKQWKMIPLLTVGFFIYAIIGKIALDQFWWYFENDPYPPTSIYGSGSWLAYWNSWKLHLGVLTVLFIPFALLGWLILRSKQPKLSWSLAIFVVGIYLGIIGMHSYLWAYGLKGALGLSRIATQGLPIFCCFLLLLTDCVSRELVRSVRLFATLVFSVLALLEISELYLPLKANPFEITLRNIAQKLEKTNLKGRKVYYLHPLISHFMGINQRAKHPVFLQTGIDLPSFNELYFKPGDLIIRDSHFGPVDQGLKLEELAKYPWIVPVLRYYPDGNSYETNGEVQSVMVYQVMDKNHFDLKAFNEKYGEKEQPITEKNHQVIASKNEFAPVLPKLIIPQPVNQQYTYSYTVSGLKSSADLYLIFDNEHGVYISKKLSNGDNQFVFPAHTTSGKFFIHNPEKVRYQLTVDQKKWSYSPQIGILSF